MCSVIEEWQSDSGNGAWFLLPTEEVTKSGCCMELGIAGGVVEGALVMALEMASRLWTTVSAGVTVGMVR
jgi:hypothetical protein